jgi:hypothetical protein
MHKEDSIMNSVDINRIERHARQMRTEEMARLQKLLATRIGAYLRPLADSALHASKILQWLFSWNPQNSEPRRPSSGPRLTTRANDLLRACFSWNPNTRHS